MFVSSLLRRDSRLVSDLVVVSVVVVVVVGTVAAVVAGVVVAGVVVVVNVASSCGKAEEYDCRTVQRNYRCASFGKRR